METSVVFSRLLALLLVVGLKSASAQDQDHEDYVKLGGTISLTPESSGPFTSVLWKHNGNLAVELLNGEVDAYAKFRGHATLNNKTGSVEIKNATKDFSGRYTVETNSQIQTKGYKVEVIKEVPRPDIAARPLACSHESESCTLVCGSDEVPGSESEFGPVTYSWREDDGPWIEGDKDKKILNDGKTNGIEFFTCEMKNPVSVQQSVTFNNPLYKEPKPSPSSDSNVGAGIGIFFVVLALIGVVVGVAWKKEKLTFLPERWQPSNSSGNNPASNGAAGNQANAGLLGEKASTPEEGSSKPDAVTTES